MTTQEEIYEALLSADANAGGKGPRAYALEAGMRLCAIPAIRVARVDSAELIGFIYNAITEDVLRGYDQYAAAIVDRFNLVGVAR
jgi:hypothetical protein